MLHRRTNAVRGLKGNTPTIPRKVIHFYDKSRDQREERTAIWQVSLCFGLWAIVCGFMEEAPGRLLESE